jgi:hypothetical protein
MKAVINRTVEVIAINVILNGCWLAVDGNLKVVGISLTLFKEHVFRVEYYNASGNVTTICDLDGELPDWLTDLIQSRPEVGSTLDAKYHGLFSEFLNQNINL